MKHTFVLLASFLLLFVQQMQAQNVGGSIDAKHYEIHLNHFDFQGKSLEAETFVTFEVTEATQSVVLELKSLTASSVTSAGANVLGFSQENDYLTVNFSETLNVGSEITLDVVYGGVPYTSSWGGVHWNGEYVYNLGVGIYTEPHNLGKAWFPCVDDFEDKANYDIFVTAEAPKMAVCGGNLIETIDNGNGSATYHWSENQMISTYHISFAVGEFVLWEDTYQGLNGEIPITVYAKPYQADNVEGSFVNIKEIVQFYEDCFGPYPFNRIGYVSTSIGCMEHIDNIGLSSSMINGTTSGEDYVAHELSHMWFGNKVTCATAEDMWLNEGFAQFCGMFYKAGIYGEATFQDEMSDLVSTITNWSNNDANWIPLNQIPLDMTYDTKAVYERGAVIVNTLMNYLGREKFLELFRAYFEQHEYQTVNSEQLRDFLSANNDFPMDDFFNTYVFTPGMPHYDLQLAEVTDLQNGIFEASLKMNYKHIGSAYVCPKVRVEVTLLGENGRSETRLVDFPENGKTAIELDFQPIAAFADYYNHFLDGKTDGNFMLTTTGKTSHANFQAEVNAITDSTLLRIENHLVGPNDDPEIPALTISTKHYWNIFRQDYGEADIKGTFTYSKSTDNDLIFTENDSATLLYRANVNEPWHEIQYTLNPQSNWRMGQFFVENFASGDYCIAVWDKELLGVQETMENQRMKIYPNPAESQINIQMKDCCDGQFVICDSQGKTLKQIAFEQIDRMSIATDGLAKGLYFVKRLDKDGTVLETETLIIR